MSWWPFSSSGADAKVQAQAQAQQASSIPSQSQSIDSPVAHIPLQTATSSPPSSAPHDPDFYAAHPHLAPPSFATNSPTPSSNNSDDAATSSDDFDPSLPRSMSCRAAFDSAFYCSSLGGHFNDIYRYGQLRSCSEHWNDFWFCMRTKNSYSGRDVKERMVQDRYREKEEKVKSGPNSEDIWLKRGVGEEVRGAFAKAADVDAS
ncbi:hypothetical protein BKA66DRAFT_418053 [Pyrenochaeta sp. MPI-SDFR-AT-0127]|nr:hypothetical protein BKA66DRAFT_418053 [Pyrenochaeta sp. MPI-SDFR-AT-0127]